jgi:hypothetical protein
MNICKLLLSTAVAAALASCGGGGADTTPPPVDTMPPVVPTGLNGPTSVAFDSAGNIYIGQLVDSVVYKLTPAGSLSVFAGSKGVGGIADGTGSAARFDEPVAVATDAAGNVYVGDIGACDLRKITPAGAVTTIAGLPENCHGNNAGVGSPQSLGFPEGVAVGANGVIYFSQLGQDTINAFDPGTGTVTVVAGSIGMGGNVDGTGAAARFLAPERIAIDAAGNLYVADSVNNLIRKIAPGGVVTTLAGSRTNIDNGQDNFGSTDGAGSVAQFRQPNGIAVGADGTVYVADTTNATIRKILPDGTTTTLAGSAGATGTADGTGAAARFNGPSGVGVDAAGNVYVADTFNSALRKITPAGVVTTIAN